MTYPILAYGHQNLRKIAVDIDKNYPDLSSLIEAMEESMHVSNGVGLAAPQINKSIRLFLVDATPYSKDFATDTKLKWTFLNAKIIEETGEEWAFNEGCLSIPGINEDVFRKSKIRIQYYDENWDFHDMYFDGLLARIIQHEYDHLDGILFTDRLSSLKKTLLKGKLADISKGKTDADYKMIFPVLKKRRKKI